VLLLFAACWCWCHRRSAAAVLLLGGGGDVWCSFFGSL
jgi:hypothetical protein